MSALCVVLVLLRFFCQNFAADFQQSSGVSVDTFVEKMIIKQHKACPYVPLCTTSSASVSFVGNDDASVPCCTPCSCNDTCVESDTCCPDFRFRHGIHKTDKRQADIYNGRECVEVRHGLLKDDTVFEAYRMIAGCPRNFTNVATLLRCQSDFDFKETESWKDSIPVYDELTGQVYKNRHCYLCNENITSNIKFWDIKLNCTGIFKFFLFFANSPRELAERYLAGGNTCDIIFYIAAQSQNSTNLKLEICHRTNHVANYISTCKPEYAGTNIEMSCTKYTWPVRINRGIGFLTYKNLACLLCNNILFAELCTFMNISKFYSVSLTSNGNDLNSHHSSVETTINKFFPDLSGKIICEKGFIFHKQQNECRRVLCPQSFFIKDGECIPIFKTLTGVCYIIYLKMVLPRTDIQMNTTSIESALYSALNQRLQQYLEKINFIISLWRNQRSTRIMTMNRKYYVLIHITGQEDFVAFIQFLHWFVVSGNRLQINLNTKLIKSVFVDLSFGNSPYPVRGEPVNNKGESLYLVKPNSWRSMVISKVESKTQAQVTSILLCYRVALNRSEIDFAAYKGIKVLETGRFLSGLSFDYHNSRIITCVDDAFKDVRGDAKYVLGYKDMKGNEVNVNKFKEEHTEYTGYGSNKEDTSSENEMFIKSLIATACSIGVIAFLIFIRKFSKYLTKRNSGSTTGYTTTINLERRASKTVFKTMYGRGKEVHESKNPESDSSKTVFCTEKSQKMSFSRISCDRFRHDAEDNISKINKNLKTETRLSFKSLDDLQELGGSNEIKGHDVVKRGKTGKRGGKQELQRPSNDDEGDYDDADDTTHQEMKIKDKRRIAMN